jgi:hypothetical protein
MIGGNLQTFLNKAVQEFSTGAGIGNPDQTVYRIAVEYDDKVSITEKIAAFAGDPKAGQVKELIIGNYATDVSAKTDADAVVDALVKHKDALKNLKALFFGDITSEECEISWIQQTDISPLLKAWPALEHLQIRGGEGLTFSDLQHDQLKTLIIETGGLPPNVITEISSARLPNLERLDLWLGDENYGFASSIEDFAAILSGKLFPKLTHLGLMDSELEDEIAFAISQAPVLKQLKVLDLSMGTLTDQGAAALRDSEGIRKLQHLNLRHHFLSEGMMAQMKTLGISVNLDDKQEPDGEYRFIEVAE